jgi:hypothetical protein
MCVLQEVSLTESNDDPPVLPGVLWRLLVVPRAHVEVSDFELQVSLYDVFHEGWISRVGHMTCTPIVLMSTMMIADRVVHCGSFGAGIVTVGLACYAIGLDVVVGLLAAPALGALLGVVAAVEAAALEPSTPALILTLTLASMAQAFSHLAEDVPPPWSHSRRFVPLGQVLRAQPWRATVGMAPLTLMAFVLEWWASYRIFGLQLHFVAMQLGLRPRLWARLQARRPLIKADHRLLWPEA